jgi:hypothetical protein
VNYGEMARHMNVSSRNIPTLSLETANSLDLIVEGGFRAIPIQILRMSFFEICPLSPLKHRVSTLEGKLLGDTYDCF